MTRLDYDVRTTRRYYKNVIDGNAVELPTAGRDPGGRAPAPGSLRLVQALVNTVTIEFGRDLLGTRPAAAHWLAKAGLLGNEYWLRVPVGKLRNDRMIPLHPECVELLAEWTRHQRRPHQGQGTPDGRRARAARPAHRAPHRGHDRKTWCVGNDSPRMTPRNRWIMSLAPTDS